MADRQELGEVGAYLLFTGFTVLIFPLAGPVIVYKNWNNYAERLDGVPGISGAGGFPSAAATFVYVLIGMALVGGAAVGLSNSIGLTSPIATGWATGGSGTGVGSTPTATVGTPTGNLVDGGGTPTDGSESELRAEREAYEQFGQSLAADAQGDGVTMGSVSANATTDTLVLRFENGGGTESVRDDQRVLLTLYADAVAGVESGNGEYNLTEIPPQVEIVQEDSGGTVLSRGEVQFAWAYELAADEIDRDEYERRFFSEVERA